MKKKLLKTGLIVFLYLALIAGAAFLLIWYKGYLNVHPDSCAYYGLHYKF